MSARLAALMLTAATLSLGACSQPVEKKAAEPPAKAEAAAPPASTAPVPAGAYTLDKPHADLSFKVNHIGFSNYTARFERFDAKLNLDPANPAASTLEVTVDPSSLSLNNPPPGFRDTLVGPTWLDAKAHPQMTFKSTKVEVTGAKTAKVTGDFTLRGITKPVTLDVTYNGGYAGHPMDPAARIGFSATGKLKRSDYGMSMGIPAPGTTMGVGDDVSIIIESEFTGPPLATGAAKAP